ncbi:MAG: hypothetical protein ABI947_11095 [Chloroflexota bacterium]
MYNLINYGKSSTVILWAMNSNNYDYDEAKQLTALSLQKLIDTTEHLTHLSLNDRSALIEEISRVLPAGNVPSLVAAGLANLPGRTVSVAENRRNLSLLMQGMQTFLDKAVYQTFFVGPATILSAYQMLLTLAGKDLNESFPEGTWQFYVEFGLREDSGRHTCETNGFQKTLEQEGIKLSATDEMACWVTASAWLLDCYPVLLANEWIEHVRLQQIETLLVDHTISQRWLKLRPYTVPVGGPSIDFTDYRKSVFEEFCNNLLANVNPRLRKKIEDAWNDKQAVARRASEIVAYQHQLSIRATLQPAEHSDSRVPIDAKRLSIATIVNKRYYLVDLNNHLSLERARLEGAAITRDKPDVPASTLDKLLCVAHRRDQMPLRRGLPEYTKAELERLRLAPIILNWDQAPSEWPLVDIRGGRRGIGDQALTIFRASHSTVFDMSHIFFDGPWGMAVAEILTGQAIHFARQLVGVGKVGTLTGSHGLDFEAPPNFATQARKVQLAPEVSGETTLADLKLIQQVQGSLRRRNADLKLTVNDILILHRVLFNQKYQPSTELMVALRQLAASSDTKSAQAGHLALATLEESRNANPSLLIPIDATSVNPRERISPTTFRNPFNNLLQQHQTALTALETLDSASKFGKASAANSFGNARRDYFSTLYAFGQLLSRYKNVSLSGESISTTTIKLLAGLPSPVQRMLDSLPGTFDVVNDVVKGQEVFSNVGRVSVASSLTRFNTAKDDNEKKVLAWGIMTDAQGVMHISLRDARPHVIAMVNAKQEALARRMAQEYVDAFAITMNDYLEALLRISRAKTRGDI